MQVTNPGRKATVDVVGEITGLDINQSVVVNLRGFQALVDAMGGVEVNVQERVCVQCHTSSSGRTVFTNDNKSEYIEPGLQHLSRKVNAGSHTQETSSISTTRPLLVHTQA